MIPSQTDGVAQFFHLNLSRAHVMQLVHILATNHLAVKQVLLSLWVGSRGTTIMFLHKYILYLIPILFIQGTLHKEVFLSLFYQPKKNTQVISSPPRSQNQNSSSTLGNKGKHLPHWQKPCLGPALLMDLQGWSSESFESNILDTFWENIIW